MDTGSLQILANPCKFACQLCQNKIFGNVFPFFPVKWVYHKLYIFQFQIFDANWPSLVNNVVLVTRKVNFTVSARLWEVDWRDFVTQFVNLIFSLINPIGLTDKYFRIQFQFRRDIQFLRTLMHGSPVPYSPRRLSGYF